MKSLTAVLFFLCISLPAYAQVELERRLGKTAWISGTKEMAFSWTGKSLALRDRAVDLSGMQSIYSSKSVGREAWVFRQGNRYFGLAFLNSKRIASSDASSEQQAASNILARNSSSTTWDLASGSLKNGVSPESRLQGSVWHSGSEEMIFSQRGDSYKIQPIFPSQKDFQDLFLQKTLDKEVWVFRKGTEYFGVRFLQNSNIITVNGLSLDRVSEELMADPLPGFRYTEWQRRL